jgi:hypothetical protein
MGGFEVRELIIKATIVPDAMGGGESGSPSATAGNNDAAPNEEIINTCVEKILEILKDKNGR